MKRVSLVGTTIRKPLQEGDRNRNWRGYLLLKIRHFEEDDEKDGKCTMYIHFPCKR
jgi:hypothetical protein